VRNVVLVDVARTFDGHGLCTAAPWVFTAEPLSDTTLAADAEHIVAAKTCTGVGSALAAPCSSLVRSADAAEQSLKDYVWRAAHPTAAGQRALAATVTTALGGRLGR
jgi:hypothetical protein